ncbi:MAG TPA: hypothetical protein VIT91_16310 [Chthoniobacterales bacterium]
MTTSAPALTTKRRRRIFSRWRVTLAILLALGVAFYVFQPQLFSWIVRNRLPAELKKHHLTLTMDKVEGDFFSGRIVLGNAVLASEIHPASKAEFGTFDVKFSPWRCLFQRDRGDRPDKNPVTAIKLVNTKIRWDLNAAASVSEKQSRVTGEMSSMNKWFPASIIGSEVSIDAAWPNGSAAAEGMEFDFRQDAAGTFALPKLTVVTPKWKRSFSDLEGTTALKEKALYAGGFKFSDDLVLERAALDFAEIERGEVMSDMEFRAFGGQLRADSRWDIRKASAFLDTAASFWNMSVDQIGAFIRSEAFAAGTIHEGRFSFRGNPADATNATITLRLNATDFRWHKRRWNSLVASALLVNHRLEIPQFSLVQDKNQIELNGNLQMPPDWKTLPTQFRLNIQAQIDDLGAAAAIIAPNQKMVAGEAFFAGTISNQQGQLSGRLRMRGGPLTLSGVAIDRVRGDLELLGTEVRATNFEFAHRDDWATGSGTFSLGEQRRYSAKLELAAQNIAEYRAILPPTISEHAVAGGIHLWWSGDGSPGVHSGAFKATLDDFVLSRAANAVPLDVNTDGSYSPGGISLNHLHVERPETKLDTIVIVRPETLEFRELKVAGKAGAKLEGNIELPVNVLKALNEPKLAALLDSSKAASGKLSATKIHLEDLAELSGRHYPIRGMATFDATVAGTWPEFKLDAAGQGQDLSFPSPVATSQKTEVDSFSGSLHVADQRLRFSIKATPSSTAKLNLEGELGIKTDAASLSQNQILALDAPLEVKAAGQDFVVAELHPWIPASRAFDGRLNGLVNISGVPKSPVFEGNLRVANGSWTANFLDAPVKRLTGTFDFQNQAVIIKDVAGEYRGGKFSVTGRAGIDPTADVTLQIRASEIPLTPSEGFEAVADGNVSLTGPSSARQLKGDITLKKAVTNRSFQLAKRPRSVRSGASPISSFRLPWIPDNWGLNLKINTEGPLRTPDWQLFPDVTVTGTANRPYFHGSLNGVSPTGKVTVYFRNQPLEQGLVGFILGISNGATPIASNESNPWNISTLLPFLPALAQDVYPKFTPNP